MTNGFDEMILNMTDTTPEPEDYTGEDGLLYCGKCHKPKEGYFPKETAAWLGRDRHPAECDCQRAEREEREAAEKQRSHLETVERLKRRGFTDPAMQGWTFENDNGKCPQMEHAHFYVENWDFPLLILDDFGMERGTEYGLEQVYNVIDSRYRSGRPLIVTTNLTLEDLQHPEDTAHARIYDRLIEMCSPVRFTGSNFRKATAQEKMGQLKKLMNRKESRL